MADPYLFPYIEIRFDKGMTPLRQLLRLTGGRRADSSYWAQKAQKLIKKHGCKDGKEFLKKFGDK